MACQQMRRHKMAPGRQRARSLPQLALATGLLLLVLSKLVESNIDFEEVTLIGANDTWATRGGGQEPAEARREAALKQPARLTVIAPKYLRPNSDYHVLINLANSLAPATIDLQLIGARDSNRELGEAKSVLASSNETQTIKFTIGDWPAAEYVLTVNAQATDRSWNFSDERPLTHQAKSYSAFIQTDKAVYKAGQTVQFRALFLTPALRPEVMKQEISAEVTDPQGNVLKQWQELSNWRGLLTLELPLSQDPMLGDYTIQVEARGQRVARRFSVAEYVLPSFEVSLQLPSYATHNESRILATVRATYTYGKPVRGQATLSVQPLVRLSQISTRPLHQAQFKAPLGPDGTADFSLDVVRDLRQQAELFERDIEFFALVEEQLTGRKYNATQRLRLYDKKTKIERLDAAQTFKPGMAQVLQFKVAYQDETPVEEGGPEVELRYAVLGRPVSSVRLQPRLGLVEHELLVPAKVASPLAEELEIVPSRLEIEAHYRGQTHYLAPMEAFQSLSHEYLQIELPQLRAGQRPGGERKRAEPPPPLRVGDNLLVRVSATEPMQQVTCQGFARGDIVWALSREAEGARQFQFEVRLEQRMAPEMRVICFHVRGANKELVADARLVPVAGLAQNVATLAPSRAEAKPGEQLEVGVFTKPNALVGVLAVDQAALLLGRANELSQTEVLADIKSYGSAADGGEADAQQLAERLARNTERLFQAAQVVVMSNNLIFDGRHSRLGRPIGSPFALQYASPVASGGGANNNNIALDSLILEHPLQPPEFHLGAKARQASPTARLRSEFPETWLWQNGTANDQGLASFSARVPDSITSWQLSAFSLSESHGLALSTAGTSLRVFRPFFIKLNLPYAIMRGESVSIQAIVFNYSKRPLVASVTLDNRARHFEFVEAANTVEEERHSAAASQSRQVTVAAQEGAAVNFLIRPARLGHIELRVVAQAGAYGDALLRKLLVKPEGQVQHMNRAVLIQLSGEPGARWQRNLSLEVPANAVEGSRKVFAAATGDILGAGLSNLDDLLRLPYGCGEQNMINLVPNIVILKYLESSGRVRAAQRHRATRNIELGYQRQLNYKRPDGSFSAFGPADANGSVWLTAYVLKSLQQAKSLVGVDERIVRQAAGFIGRLARADGSIEELGMLHNRALASHRTLGGGGGADTGAAPIYLTAYAMIALLQRPIEWERADEAAGQAPRKPTEVIEAGLDYLERQLTERGASALGTYELAIMAYALQLAGGARQEAAGRAYEALWARASQLNDHTWWPVGAPEVGGSGGERESAEALDAGSARLVSEPPPAQPPLKPLAVKADQSAHLFMPDSLAVEQSAWALLTAVRRRELERALPIVRWLVSQQNSRGGFASTQDTVLAIEALASYAEAAALARPAPATSMEVEFVYPREPAPGALRRTGLEQLLVRQSNALVQQQTRLPDDIAWLQIQASGAGTAVVQVSWQYNLLVAAERPAFYLNPLLDRRSSANYLQLSVCFYYKAGQVSNMALLEVQLPSGYVADMEALAGLRHRQQVRRVEAEEAETRLLVYLERVTRDELCLTVPAHRSTRVSNNRPVPVTIYDYYDRKQAARIFYAPPAASSCDICEAGQACGEQCGEPKRAARLVSLHEQRRLAPEQQPAQLAQPPAANQTSGRAEGSAPLSLALALSRDAFAYLPLTSAFSQLVGQAGRRPAPR